MSIKNDGHYFCRAGGNRPDGLNEPVTKKKLIERYQRDWQLMAGNEEAQAKCVQVMNIRVNELKQAA
ncbi:hypothetical protein [Escherichia coli]|uniref:hypothetical protein n=1 Tax=Escherichia coli TaxID=562 RepID=UPI000250FAFD|nr:hypothetical protein ECDEC1E_5448 [Escherichia coli DEC1E]